MSTSHSTPQHITHLINLSTLCTLWSQTHIKSRALFNSLHNVNSQRQDTLFLLSSKTSFLVSNLNSISSSEEICDEDPILNQKLLHTLIYKQSCEIESILLKIHQSLDEFEKILKEMHGIYERSNRLIGVHTNEVITNNNSGAKVISPSPSSTSESQFSTDQVKSSPSSSATKKKSPSKSKKKFNSSSSPSKTSSIQNLLKGDKKGGDIAEISIPLSNLYCTRVLEKYSRELIYKRNLIQGGTLKVDQIESVKFVAELWEEHSFMTENQVEENILDRIKIWKRVNEYLEVNS
ncbi:4661_t:CDS:1 [Ambispora gerdemannii]|uniref:4661_t:CDS:1 n=1 Tax=Ambispora gerdemannii TaxID=144530 RepID=A0A9N9F2Q1_9GLOM|nr:4661_t:CDS:1 [Ambispora gerdemannii]